MARRLAGLPDEDRRSLEEVWAGMRLPYLLFNWLRRPLAIRQIVHLLGTEPGRQGLLPEVLQHEVEAALLVGPCLPDSHPLRLRPRVHRFLRGLARFWRCTNPDCGRLLSEGVDSCGVCGSRALPLAICRTCGWDFFVGRESNARIVPWLERSSTGRTVYYYDPPLEPVEADTEESPFEDEDESQATGEGSAADQAIGEEAEVEVDTYVCPTCLSLNASAVRTGCVCGEETPLRPVRARHGRGTRCPVCNSRYGRFDVLTPVSLGNSSALSHVSRSLLRELPEQNKKILVFCDSRQDAAHQARFIEGVESHLRLRRAVYRLLGRDMTGHDLRWLVENVYYDFVHEGFLPRTRARDAINREMDKIEGALLSEFVLAANVRSSLERLGLVSVDYAGLEDEFDSSSFRELCTTHGLSLEATRIGTLRLFDFVRSRFAVTHEAFKTRLYRGDRLSIRFALTPGRQVGIPVAFLRPGNRSENTVNYKLMSTWNASGVPAGMQRLWRQVLGAEATIESLTAALEWAHHQGWLVWSRIGQNADEAEGYQLAWETLELAHAAEFVHCNVCGRAAPNEGSGRRCTRPGCEGQLVPWVGPLAEGNLNATLIAAEYAPPLKPAEHSAAISDSRRREVEEGFQADPPIYNVLVCTPTLELGVNIGDLEAICMRNVPPSPANYAQRAGRTGRRSRMGMAVGFARNTPHDGYFFDHPEEVIVGAIPPPRFHLANLQAVARHVRSLVLQYARLDFPSNLEPYISEEGAVNSTNLQPLIRQVTAALPRAAQAATDVFGPELHALREDWEAWLGQIIREVPNLVQSAIEMRAALVENAVRQMRELAQPVRQTQRQHDAEQGYRNLAGKLRGDYRYAYLPRVLAEMGIIPGYSFPGDPGSLSLAYDLNPVFTGRLQAQREFAPSQIVYARGHRWKVGGVALNRPGAANRNRGTDQFEFTECTACGLAGPSSGANHCTRCGAELSGPSSRAWDVGAFQAWPADVEPETEEERQSVGFDVRVHPQRDVPARNFQLGPWTFELRLQEQIWWINHGRFRLPFEEGMPRSTGFRLCPVCGELRPDPHVAEANQNRRGRRRRDPRADRDPHDERCGGVPVDVMLGHQDRADTLRLIAPGIQGLGEEGVAWAWSLAWAVVQGAVRLFDLDEDDLEARVLTRDLDGRTEALEIIWVDNVLGGSGILEELVGRFPTVAASAVEHLSGHDCPSSCYRCLRTYRNQRVHGMLNWRLVSPQLVAASADTVIVLSTGRASPHVTEGPEWVAARKEGCGSPLELRLLQAIRQVGLPEPERQFQVNTESGRTVTIADLAYRQQRILIYVDGLAFHSSLRMRVHDTSQTNRLQAMGYRVLRFVGPRVASSPTECALEVRDTLRSVGL